MSHNTPAEVFGTVYEMTASAESVKGAQFAAAVGALFSVDGLKDLGERLLAAVPSVGQQYTQAINGLHDAVSSYVLATLANDTDRQEARKLADNMFYMQRKLHESMRG